MKKSRIGIALAVCLVLGTVAAVAQAATGDTLGISTLTQRILPNGSPGYDTLTTGPGENYTVRDGSTDGATTGLAPLGVANAGRETKRTSLAYFGQLTDFQLADEESPARVEFLDSQGGAFTAAWRPGEALNPQEENSMIQQMNAFAANAPVANGDSTKPGMDFVMNTGDIADSQQANEVLWNRQLIDGDMVDPGSGVDPTPSIGVNPLCPAGTYHDTATPSNYTGVQDPNDWPAGLSGPPGYFYNPDDPNLVPPTLSNLVPYADAPEYPGLMNRAQQPFQATGLDVPGYVLFGNHDGLVQGNAYASGIFNEISKGCIKPMADAAANGGEAVASLYALLLNPNLTQQDFLDLYAAHPKLFTLVPPDPGRHLVNKKQYKDIWKADGKDDGHGFGFVDPAEDAAANGSAGYYSWSPKPGIRYITLDTHSEGGKILESDEGNLDDPQFQWLDRTLQQATADNEIVVIFSHHAVTSLDADVADENAPKCENVDPDVVIGCDADPRDSMPIHLENTTAPGEVTSAPGGALGVKEEILKYPNVVAWVAGHSHENEVTPFKNPNGEGGFWSIRTAALADWPKQNRLLQIFDDHDGNLSIFGTLIDEASPVPTPAPGTSAAGMSTDQLASISRELGYNDSQNGARKCGANPCGEGKVEDRNVELLVKDPRKPVVPPTTKANVTKVQVLPKKKNLKAGKKIKLTVKVTNGGTAAAKNIKVNLKSSNRNVKVRKSVVIKSIGIKKTVAVKVTVRAKGKAKGKARIIATVPKGSQVAAARKATSNLKIKEKKKHRKRH